MSATFLFRGSLYGIPVGGNTNQSQGLFQKEPSINELTRRSRCVMPEARETIIFDETGACNMDNKSGKFNLVFPAGISAVKGFGMEKWVDNFFMPVPRNTRDEGFESIFISSEMKLGDAEKKLPELLSFPVISGKLDVFHLLVEKWRAIRTNWGVGSFSSCLLPSVFNSKLYILGGRGSGEVRAYLKDLGTEPLNLRPDLYMRKAAFGEFTSAVEPAIGIFKNEMCGILKKYGLALPEGYWQEFSRHMDGCAEMISGTRKNICGWAQSELIINPVANLKHRIFASAWRLSGGSVTGTTHGNVFAYQNISGDMINGCNIILNRFVTMSSGEKKLFESANENYKTGLESSVEVYPCINTMYREKSEKLKKGSPAKSIKKVMLIGSPLNGDLQFPDMLCYLLMEIELVSLLIKNDYHVIYKAHPDTLDETRSLFDMPGCERSNDRFENVWESCDYILFPHVFTTAFGLSLMTTKHIIALRWKDNSAWRPTVSELLQKRISIIDVDYNRDGKPILDRRALLDSLSSPNEPDYSVVEKLMFGSRFAGAY
ncbi:MAG: hypothetical protein NT118_11765 [Lentisphaerae bacterium]|nr:hypothetical protein [Lentisphaerota bacterium]